MLEGIAVGVFIILAFAGGYYLREPEVRRVKELLDTLQKEKTDLLGLTYQRLNYKPQREIIETPRQEQAVAEVPRIPDLFKRQQEAIEREAREKSY